MPNLLTAFCALAAMAASASAQPQGTWAGLSQLPPNAQARLTLSDGKTLRGSLQSVTPDSLSIRTATGQETLARPQIKAVHLKGQGHRGRNTVIGLGIGLGGGLTIGAAIDHGSRAGWFPNLGKAVFTPLGAIVGTIIGVAIPTGRWREIYRAP